MPRLLLNVISAVTNKVPPFNTNDPAVAEPGTPPRLRSVLIDKVPALIIVPPVYVLVPESIKVLLLIFVNEPEPSITPPNVMLPPLVLIDELEARVIAPA